MKRIFAALGASVVLALGISWAALGQQIFPYSQQADGSVIYSVPQANALHLQRNEPIAPGGRLTYTSNSPIQTATLAGGTSVFYTAFKTATVPVFIPTVNVTLPPKEPGALTSVVAVPGYWQNYNLCAFPQITAAGLPNPGACEQTITLGANYTANTNFDVFAEANIGLTQNNSSGVNANYLVELCVVPWTNQTTRATVINLTGHNFGFLTNNTAATCRVTNSQTVTLPANQGTFLGTFATGAVAGQVNYTNGASASGGTAAVVSLWNEFNRVQQTQQITDSGATYTYSSNTIRQARASAGNQISLVNGAPGCCDDAIVMVSWQQPITTAAAVGARTITGIGLDSTTTFLQATSLSDNAAAAQSGTISGSAPVNTGLGLHVISLNEQGDNVNTNTLGGTVLAPPGIVLSASYTF